MIIAVVTKEISLLSSSTKSISSVVVEIVVVDSKTEVSTDSPVVLESGSVVSSCVDTMFDVVSGMEVDTSVGSKVEEVVVMVDVDSLGSDS